jgi:hypothetical protein
MAQVVELLPSKHEALNSNPSTTKNKKEKNIYIYNILQKYYIKFLFFKSKFFHST